jgi:YkoY family integral membrane protein
LLGLASDGFIIFWLVVLEGLLSVDNALILATMVSILPAEQRKKALLYGLLGAYIFRIIAVLFAVFLLEIWWFKVVGGLYLFHIGYKGLRVKEEKEGFLIKLLNKFFSGESGIFWAVVVQLNIIDLFFSVDSILAAVALTEKIWLVILGGMIGILIMRLVANMFVKFLEQHPLFKKTAYVLILVISVKLIISPWQHPPKWIFFLILTLIFLGTFVIEKAKNKSGH